MIIPWDHLLVVPGTLGLSSPVEDSWESTYIMFFTVYYYVNTVQYVHDLFTDMNTVQQIFLQYIIFYCTLLCKYCTVQYILLFFHFVNTVQYITLHYFFTVYYYVNTTQ